MTPQSRRPTAGDPYHLALDTAFRPDHPANQPPMVPRYRVRLRPYAIAFVAGFPGLVGAVGLAAALSRGGTSDGAFLLATVLLVATGALLALGLGSYLALDEESVSVRFYGVRATRVRFDELVAATFGMAFPSISFSVALKDRRGKRSRIHMNWWQREREIMPIILRELLGRDVAMDRQTAEIVAMALKVKAPTPRIVRAALFKRDRSL